MRQLKAEGIKLTSTRLPGTLVLVAAAFVALVALASMLTRGEADLRLDDLLGAAAPASFFVFVLGLLGLTGEYRHRTLTPTYAAQPRRTRVYLAKLLVLAMTGVVTAVLALLAAWVLALVGSAVSGDPLVTDGAWGVAVRTVFLFAGMSLLGVGVGAVIRNELAAVVGGLVYLFIIESLVTGLAPAVGKWLVFSSGTGFASGAGDASGQLAWWLGGLVFAAYTVVALSAGVVVSRRVDITA